MKRKLLPGQHDGEPLEDYIKRSWEAEPGLKQEFDNDFQSYQAFCRADVLNLVKILSKKK